MHFRDLVFGFLDFSMIIFLVLPLFRQKTDVMIYAVSLLSLTGVEAYWKIAYLAIVIGMISTGILTLILKDCSSPFWDSYKNKISLLLNGIGVLLFTLSLHPYAAIFLFIFLVIKVLILTKKQ